MKEKLEKGDPEFKVRSVSIVLYFFSLQPHSSASEQMLSEPGFDLTKVVLYPTYRDKGRLGQRSGWCLQISD